jgi:hypothetical protein
MFIHRFALATALPACVLLAAGVSAQQPRITNGQVAARPASSGLSETFRAVVDAQNTVAWIAYAVPARDRDHTMCCWTSQDGSTYFSGTTSSSDPACCGLCRIEPSTGGAQRPATGSVPPAPTGSPGPVKLEGPESIVVLFRVVDRQVERIKTFSDNCTLDAGGRPVHWLEGVRPAESLALLESFAGAERERKNRISSAALQSISMHAEPSAVGTIERLARSHPVAGVRGDALFWLAQMAGQKVASTITAAIENDPDTEVKRRAVFALSQLPKNEGVPLLIQVARTNRNPAVRKQAIFWLGQSRDPRALEYFAEILK